MDQQEGDSINEQAVLCRRAQRDAFEEQEKRTTPTAVEDGEEGQVVVPCYRIMGDTLSKNLIGIFLQPPFQSGPSVALSVLARCKPRRSLTVLPSAHRFGLHAPLSRPELTNQRGVRIPYWHRTLPAVEANGQERRSGIRGVRSRTCSRSSSTTCASSVSFRCLPGRVRHTMTRHLERHRTKRTGWLRAAVLGANDGIVSTASLVLGVAATHATHSKVLVTGVTGLVAGAMAMAAGEYVSVHSQADTEKADVELERKELKTDDAGEHTELAAIYVGRGLDPALAKQVANQLMAHDGLGAHVRDELGISGVFSARPIQAALASAASFAIGAAMPLLVMLLVPEAGLFIVAGTSLVFLALLGAVAARAGGASMTVGAMRVTFWGALAMGLTAGVGALFGAGA